MSIDVVLADDHRIMREALRSSLEKASDINVVGEAEDGRAAINLAMELHPHVVVMDISMPNLNGIEATRILKSRKPEIKVVGLSQHFNKYYIMAMVEAGADGFVPKKDSSVEELAQSIYSVADGGFYLSPKIARSVAQAALDPKEIFKNEKYKLTTRETEVLQLVAEGKTTKEIATDLKISEKTVECHRGQIKNKLNLGSIAEQTKFAMRQGLTD